MNFFGLRNDEIWLSEKVWEGFILKLSSQIRDLLEQLKVLILLNHFKDLDDHEVICYLMEAVTSRDQGNLTFTKKLGFDFSDRLHSYSPFQFAT